MEFRYRAGDDRGPPFLSSVSDSYFAANSLRAGFYGEVGRGEMPALGPLVSAREALERELQKARIREELIAREIAQRRILEEEVRREMEVERQMVLRRAPPGRLSSCLHGLGSEGGGRVPERLGVGGVPNLPESKVVETLLHPVQPKDVVPKNLHLPQQKPDTLPSAEVKQAMTKLSGTKRKAGLETGEFCCALCQVSTTSKQGLDEHLGGKRHKSKESTLSGKKQLDKNNKASTLPAKDAGKPSPPKDLPVNGLVKDKAKRLKKQKRHFWCEFCKVKCNSEAIMNAHLNGKKHKAQLEVSERNDMKSTISTFSSVQDSKDATNKSPNEEEENKDLTYKEEVSVADKAVEEAPGAATQSDEPGCSDKEKGAADSADVTD